MEPGEIASPTMKRGEHIFYPTIVTATDHQHLRVLIADEKQERLAPIAAIVVALGHTVIAQEVEVEHVGGVTAREQPDVALVRLGDSSEHALELSTGS